MKRLLCILLLSALRAAAQSPAPPALTDVLLLTDGTELRGHVAVISPNRLGYFAPAAPADTLWLPVAQVFLLRYANGTREVLHPLAAPVPAAPAGPLDHLSAGERNRLGQQDAQRSYVPRGVMAGTAMATFYFAPVGIIVAAATGPPRHDRLNAAQPALLNDLDYANGYREQARVMKRRKAWNGVVLGLSLELLLLGLVASGQ